jgi:hypothetical protein
MMRRERCTSFVLPGTVGAMTLVRALQSSPRLPTRRLFFNRILPASKFAWAGNTQIRLSAFGAEAQPSPDKPAADILKFCKPV